MTSAIDFDDMNRNALEQSLDSAPSYERFAPAAKHAIRVIHGLPSLFSRCSLDEIEIYVGRTAFDPQSLRGRWRSHESNRHHRFGLVLFSCPTSAVMGWERAANRLMKRLERRKALCVANATAGGQGPLPGAEHSCVYLTWRFKQPHPRSPIARGDLLDLVSELWVEGADEPSWDSWCRALVPLPTPRDHVRPEWSDRVAA